jgi:DNA replication protein DnaC
MNWTPEDDPFNAWLTTQPQEAPCTNHPDTLAKINPEQSRRDFSADSEMNHPSYYGCEKCCEVKRLATLERAGVPEALMHCTFSNWTPRNDSEKEHLEKCKEFTEVGNGFLVLLGPVGVGKSHLAVAVARSFYRDRPWPHWVKQSTLLRQLRATYNDHKAKDPIEECQKASLLVLDECGVSGGGKDEGPMLHEILDHRYGEKKPTVITSNLPWPELQSEVGERLADRLRESAFGVLVFSGESHRVKARDIYFNQPAKHTHPPEVNLNECMW